MDPSTNPTAPAPAPAPGSGGWWQQLAQDTQVKAKALAERTSAKAQALAEQAQTQARNNRTWQWAREGVTNERRVIFDGQQLGLTVVRDDASNRALVSSVDHDSPAGTRGVVAGSFIVGIGAVHDGRCDEFLPTPTFDDFATQFPALPRPAAVTFALPPRTGKLGVMQHNLEDEMAKTVTMVQLLTRERFDNPMFAVPREVLVKAKGLAFLRTARIGFGLSATGGTGLVVTRLGEGLDEWSAPCAIGTGALGWGLQLGAELTDLLLVLNTDKAVAAFASGTQLTLGGNVGIAAGPVGRQATVTANISDKNKAAAGGVAPADAAPTDAAAATDEDAPGEAEGGAGGGGGKAALAKLKNVKPAAAAVFSYSCSKGLFVGISLEGAVITPRHEVNSKFYGEHKRPAELLASPAPVQAHEMCRVLASALALEHDPNDVPPPPFTDPAAAATSPPAPTPDVPTATPAPAQVSTPAGDANPWGAAAEDDPAASFVDVDAGSTVMAEAAPLAAPVPAPPSQMPPTSEPMEVAPSGAEPEFPPVIV